MSRRPLLRRWFLPAVPDLLGLLRRQGAITLAGLEAFDRWAGGDDEAAAELRTLEHAADAARRQVVASLRSAFSTPVEPEDIFELSERLDGVLNQAKDLVREAEVCSVAPDEAMAEMGHLVLAAVGDLTTAIAKLGSAHEAATLAADAAVSRQRTIERVYRRAMSDLLEHGDAREIGTRRELYRRYARIGEAIEQVADRIWYAVVKRA